MSRIPDIIAHRGVPRECLENTLPSFGRALAQGADGIELDVHATRDGVIVVHHDPVLPVETTAGPSLVAIAELTAEEVAKIPLSDGSTVPTLDSVFALVGDAATVYVEVKAARIENALVKCLERHPRARLAIHAFDHRIPVEVRRLRAGTSIGLLSSSYPTSLARFVEGAHADTLWQQGHLIDEALIRDAHTLGMQVIAWTVNDPEHAERLRDWGIDALCTDTPFQIRDRLTNDGLNGEHSLS